MKGYKYTIESIGRIVTSFVEARDRIPISKFFDCKIFTIEEDGGKVHINTANIIRITEEEVEI